jgi:hypothetical protein
MSLITRKKGSFHNLEFEVDLSNYGKVDGDITDITFIVKNSGSDSDASALLTKKLSLTEINKVANAAGNMISVSVQWGNNEYGNFMLNKEYMAGLFFQFSGDPVHDENVDTMFTVKVIEDFIDA